MSKFLMIVLLLGVSSQRVMADDNQVRDQRALENTIDAKKKNGDQRQADSQGRSREFKSENAERAQLRAEVSASRRRTDRF